MELQEANHQMVADRDGHVEGHADLPQQMRLLQQQQGLSFQVHFTCFKHFVGGKVSFPGRFRLKQTDTVSYDVLHVLNVLWVEK